MDKTMQAVVMTAFGAPDVLVARELPVPRPGPGDMLLKVAACGIDRKDLLVRDGTVRRKSSGYMASASDARPNVEPPLVLGTEISGTVVEVGDLVKAFRPGDRVATLPRRGHCGLCMYCRTGRSESCPHTYFIGQDVDGGYAQYVLVGPDSAWKVPDGVDLVEASLGAACIGTIVRAIRDIGEVRVGETVLITGASGGLGMHAIQLARLAGAHVVTIASSEQKARHQRELGAHEAIVVPHGGDWSAQVLEATGGRGADVCIDMVGAAVWNNVMRSMALYGRIVLVGEVGSGSVDFRPVLLLYRRLQVLGSYAPSISHLATALDLLARGDIRAVIDSRLPLEQARAGHALMEAGQATGRVVLVPSA